ncbi:MAG: hypothetical protein CME63_12515 [Halobacteriovoraceae bacterium]|nr:hypothetical protein [Halobacteriovoraceae bacterium]MBC98565.1 hypothetical protein [Halobacteriovoraceae bacterium]|tara:strand:- start:929 stop:1423 length:495 start_codon:yes stop_codon:yes gene_type:complete
MKYQSKYLFITFICVICGLFPSQVMARLLLDVSVLNKKGIDIGLTLGSEIHSREEVRRDEDINLAMKSGLSVLLRASFNPEIESGKSFTNENFVGPRRPDEDAPVVIIGPSSKVIIRGRIIGTDGSIIKDFFENPLVVSLGEETIVTHSKDSQLVELKIKPHIK